MFRLSRCGRPQRSCRCECTAGVSLSVLLPGVLPDCLCHVPLFQRGTLPLPASCAFPRTGHSWPCQGVDFGLLRLPWPLLLPESGPSYAPESQAFTSFAVVAALVWTPPSYIITPVRQFEGLPWRLRSAFMVGMILLCGCTLGLLLCQVAQCRWVVAFCGLNGGCHAVVARTVSLRSCAQVLASLCWCLAPRPMPQTTSLRTGAHQGLTRAFGGSDLWLFVFGVLLVDCLFASLAGLTPRGVLPWIQQQSLAVIFAAHCWPGLLACSLLFCPSRTTTVPSPARRKPRLESSPHVLQGLCAIGCVTRGPLRWEPQRVNKAPGTPQGMSSMFSRFFSRTSCCAQPVFVALCRTSCTRPSSMDHEPACVAHPARWSLRHGS